MRSLGPEGTYPSASTQAAALNRATGSRPSRASGAILQMQRQYGNRHVQRVMGMARQDEGNSEVPAQTEAAIHSAQGGGRVLDSGVRAKLEPAFGADFGSVRVHTDSHADSLNQSLRARAFTTGRDIFFRQGEYNPGSSRGQELLAHELTHVVQQGEEAVQVKLTVSQPGDALEREADEVAHSVIHQVRREVNQEDQERPVLAQSHESSTQRRLDELALQRCPSGTAVQKQDGEDDRSYEQPQIYYSVDEDQSLSVPKTSTYWGTVPDLLDDSYFKTLLEGRWRNPRMTRGVGGAGLHLTFRDWRDEVPGNAQYFPDLDASVRWEHRQAHERLNISPGVMEYDPDGGGGVRVVVQYSYGGYRTTERGQREGYHNLLFNITYDPQMSVTSGTGVEIGGEYRGASASVSASSSVTVGRSGLSFVREIAFHSWG